MAKGGTDIREISLSTKRDIDSELRGYGWGDSDVTRKKILTYYFPDTVQTYDDSGYASVGGFKKLSSTQRDAVTDILQKQIAGFANLQFSNISNGNAVLRFGLANTVNYTNDPTVGMTGAHVVGGGTEPTGESGSPELAFNGNPPMVAAYAQGDVWLAPDFYDNPKRGTAPYVAFQHEIGHALGLKHSHVMQSFHGESFPAAIAEHNSYEYSIMTYSEYNGDPDITVFSSSQQPMTYMQNDIAALQYIYGANYGAGSNNTDTVYSWSDEDGTFFINGNAQFTPSSNYVLQTIWDGGGSDTYDLSNFVTDLSINLNPGEWIVLDRDPDSHDQRANLGTGGSGAHFAVGNIANALADPWNPTGTGFLIEKAIGGIGNDIITGNKADNVLTGGAGVDVIDGGEGVDTVQYFGKFSDYLIQAVRDDATSTTTYLVYPNASVPDTGLDTLKNIEFISFLGDHSTLDVSGAKMTLVNNINHTFSFVSVDGLNRTLGISPSGAQGASALSRGFGTLDADSDSLNGLPPLTEIPVLGQAIAEKIEELKANDALHLFEDIREQIMDALASIPDSGDIAQQFADAINNLPGFSFGSLEASANGNIVRLHILANDTLALNLGDLDVDIGTDVLGLDATATGVHAGIGGALDLLLDLDVDTGDVAIVDSGTPELQLSLDAGVTVEADATLGILDVHVDDNKADDEVQLAFSLDLPTGAIAALSASDIGLDYSGSAGLDLGITTTLPTSLLPTIAGDLLVNWDANLPGEGLKTTIAFNDVTLDLGSLIKTLSDVFQPLGDIWDSFPIGTMLDALTEPLPVIDTLAKKIGVESYLDVVPLEHGDGNLSLLDVAVLALKLQGASDSDDRIKSIGEFAKAIHAIDSMIGEGGTFNGDLGVIQLGSFNIAVPDNSSANTLVSAKGGITTFDSSSGPAITQTETPPDPTQQANDKIAGSDAFKDGTAGREGLNSFGQSVFASGFSDAVGFKLPILDDPTAAVKILLNAAFPDDPVTIVQYDLPALQFGAYYERFFPVVGPIGAVLAGRVDGRIDFGIGYDTSGLAAGGLSDFEKGFFVTTNEWSQGSNIWEPVAELKAGILAGAALSIGVGSAGVTGGIFSETDAFLNDPDKDGKLYFSDFDHCLINPLEGKLTAELSAFLKFGWGPFSWTRTFKIADATLFDYSFGCDGADEDEMGGLATLGPATDPHHPAVPAGVLELNVGNRHDLRHSSVPDYVLDDDEHYAIRNAVDPNGVLIPGALQVGAYTQIETFGGDPVAPISLIHADFGKDDDSLIIDQTVLTPSEIHGNDGNDLLSGGGGHDELYGDDGDDVISGGAGDDRLFGDDGSDTLEGGAGADYINGGQGSGDDVDQVTYENSPVGVTFTSIADIDGASASLGHGGDAEGDVLVSIEYIIGSHFSDELHGNMTRKNTLEGLEGDDWLYGGKKDDYILGGPGADHIYGFSGEDGTSYLTSNGAVQIDLTTGAGHGGDAEGDDLSQMEDVQGTLFDDVLRGNAADNILDGIYGDDVIEGRGGRDTITAGAGNDIIYALGDADLIDGGSGRDLLSYVKRTSSGITVSLLAQTNFGGDTILFQRNVDHSDLETLSQVGLHRTSGISSIEDLDGTDLAGSPDSLTGDDAANRIRGFAGNDQLYGGEANDTLNGGAGADRLDGGAGRDWAEYIDSTAKVGVNLQNGTGTGGDAQGDTLISIENLRGSDYGDFFLGNSVDNIFDPRLSRLSGPDLPDSVAGGGGNDTLYLNWGLDDTGTGLSGGYDSGSNTDGSIRRNYTGTSTPLDRVVFAGISNIQVIGTMKDDTVYGGGGNDMLLTGSGNDLIYGGGRGIIVNVIDGYQRAGTQLGADLILAGDGNDRVVYGTNENRAFTKDIRIGEGQTGFAPFYLDGGKGIDGLSINLTNYSQDFTLIGHTSEFTGTNLAFGGSYVANFEVMQLIYTGGGNDVIGQAGFITNIFDGGAGQDVFMPGLGTDGIQGGTDFSNDPDGGLVIDFINNAGDLLILDYSGFNSTTGVTGQVTQDNSPLATAQIPALAGLKINNGSYTYDGYTQLFLDIERLDVTGSNKGDLLVGTNNYAQNRNPNQPQANSSQTLRGADILRGGEGNDVLIGNNGNDTLEGGNGDDVLIGADPYGTFILIGRAYTDNYVDQTEVDTLTGGAGADRFVLGTSNGFYYGYTVDWKPAGTTDQNRAIITDFNQAEGDKLQLYGSASLYTTVTTSTGLNLFLKEPNGGQQWIAELQGLTSFNLNGPGVIYGGNANFTPSASSAAIASFADGKDGAFSDGASAHVLAPLSDPGPLTFEEFVAQHSTPEEIDPAALSTGSGEGAKVLAKDGGAATLDVALPWITQNNDPASIQARLAAAIAGSGIDPASIHVELDGNAEAFGTFDGDPFGLGSGIVLSTGKVTDLDSPNTVNGAANHPRTAQVTFHSIGIAGSTAIFMADLSDVDFDINSITLADNNSRVGGSGGAASGFDIDNVVLSRTALAPFSPNTVDVNDPGVLPALDVFDLTAGGILYSPGTTRALGPLSAIPSLNSPDFFGTVNGIIINPASLGVRDGTKTQVLGDLLADGIVTLGDGGKISFNLDRPVSTEEPLYLYVGEFDSGGETLAGTISVSDQRTDAVSDLSTDFGEVGADNDTTTMTFTFSKMAGSSDDTIMFSFVMFSEELPEFAGSAFNDTVKIMLNGENLAALSDGDALTVNNLMASQLGPFHQDLVLNPPLDGPLANSVAADAYTKTLTFMGHLQQTNTITIQVKDVSDGKLDTGVLLKAASTGQFGDWTTLDFNDAPVFSGMTDVPVFDAGGPPVVLQHLGRVSDAELDTLGYAGSSLHLSRAGAPDARDVFGFTGLVTLSGNDLVIPVFGNLVVGTVTGNSGGKLDILFNGALGSTAAAIVLESITYSNSAPHPETVQLLWEFSDGNTGAQGLGGPRSAFEGTEVEVQGGNQPPVAGADAISVDEDATTGNLVALLLGNDSDPDGGTLTILSVEDSGTLGTLAFDQATQTLTYSADDPSFDPLEPGDTATTSFQYTVRDSLGGLATATVAVTVNGQLNDDDYIYGTPNNDNMTGSDASEKFRALAGNDVIQAGGGDDRVEAGPGNDILYGGTGHNLLFGEAGNDTFGNEAVRSVNLFDGGPDVDTLVTRTLPGERVTVDLVAGTVTGGYFDGSTLVDIENLKTGNTDAPVTFIGDGKANALTGGLLADILIGGDGNDTLQASSGEDLLDGGAGADVMGGGAGNDVFVFRPGETQGDRILDFMGNGAAPGDSLRFEGFGPGAYLTSSGINFTVHYAGGTETFAMNTPILHPTDYIFADGPDLVVDPSLHVAAIAYRAEVMSILHADTALH